MTRFVRLLAVVAVALVGVVAPISAQSTGTISGRVTGEGSPMNSAQVIVVNASSGAQFGALSNPQGRYTVSGLQAGTYLVQTQVIGYTSQIRDEVVVGAGQTVTLDFDLVSEAVSLGGVEVFASRAEDRRTPIAFTDVKKVQIQNQLGSRDLPLVLNVTPSVYATQQGGGAGDARLNVRGFSQRNTAVMINGVPVNDMENGWVYWSNWDGLGDAATSIQLQRGLSAVNLATPSIGGTLNVITDPSQQRSGFTGKQEFGSGGFLKTTVTANTGEIGRFAATFSGVRKTGDGVIDGTYTDSWSYYLATSFQASANNRFELYAVGAPQTHGQRLYKLNAATYSHSFAQSLDGYDPAALAKFPEAGETWNPNWNRFSGTYTGQQYASTGPETGLFDRQQTDALWERENYFHKPQVNLNWFSYLGNGLTLSTVGYYSGGRGGGSGTMGRERYDYSFTQRILDWDATIAQNQAQAGGVSNSIIRSSVNNQDTWGGIMKLRKDFQNGVTSEVGLDWRTAEIEHYRDVRDLLGGTSFECGNSSLRRSNDCTPSAFWSANDRLVTQGDRIDYNNTNTVDWLGGFFQAEKSSEAGTLYGMVGVSQISYNFEDFWKRDPNNSSQTLKLESGNLTGYQIKGGAVRNVNSEWSLYTNAGYVSKVPIFDGVIDDGAAIVNPDPKNERFVSLEAGAKFRGIDRGISFDISLYHTTWKDRTRNQFVRNIDGNGNDGLVNLLGLDARHSGIEFQGGWQPSSLMRFDVAGSLGSWAYTNDVEGTYRPDQSSSDVQTFNFYLDGLKVGDAPQTQFSYAASLFPVQGLFVQAVGKMFSNHYSEYDPFSRTDAGDREQSWKAPGYTVFDLHAAYNITELLPGAGGGDVRMFVNVYNLFDKMYVQDAVDNSSFNGFDGDHDADDAEIFLGLPRTYNIGFSIRY